MSATEPSTRWLSPPGDLGFTVADLHALPNDGLRYELIDGSIVVSPAPTLSHNMIARWIAEELEATCPGREWVVSTDQSASIDDRNEPRPDIVVATTRYLRRTPIPMTGISLVAEVVSPNSGLRDKRTKRDLYADAKVPAYWIIEPDDEKAVISLTELRLHGTSYLETAHTADVFDTTHPWPARIDLPEIAGRWAEYLELAD